jgi:hypothetical protein
MLMTVKEVQGKGGIQQTPIRGHLGCPVEVLQATDLLESCLLEMDLQVAVITPGYFVRKQYLEKGSIVQPLPASEGKSFRKGVEEIAQPETLEQRFELIGSCHMLPPLF